ncbi:tetratricopeptide repeat protein [Lysobacter capsici]|uniref:tetratricopeptide repeat protein n=1 Tax=Lysobacter capsici TaxID=435897 RepID=UPI0012FDA6EE|nr:tetratricopeptide repeat protein [Lysobacter capsici]
METPKLPDEQRFLLAAPQSLKVVFSEEGGNPLAFVLPPAQDICEMEAFREENFSIGEYSDKGRESASSTFKMEYDQLNSKRERYGESPIFISKLATLAHYAGEKGEEWGLLNHVTSLCDDAFYRHRYGEALMAQQRFPEAEVLFGSLDLARDVLANLRLAYFCVHRREFDRAQQFISAALDIDPIDYAARLFDGGIKIIKGNCEGAIQSLRVALKERPGSAVAHCNMAIAFLGVKENIKAMSALKKSVALDPLNVNALVLLSDVSFELKRDEEALPSLRYFVQFEQKNAPVWSRLARAAFRMAKIDEAIEALKRQGSVEESGGVWNNLGVAYRRKGDKERALQNFYYVLSAEKETRGKDYFVAAKNIIYMLSTQGGSEAVIDFVSSVIRPSDGDIIASDEQLSEIVSLYVNALYERKKVNSADSLVFSFLNKPVISDGLSVWLVSAFITNKSLRGDDFDLLLLADRFDEKAGGLSEHFFGVRECYFNNVAFALAEIGDLHRADYYLSRVANSIHKSAYPTATCGLLHFRRGRMEKAVSLYEEAIRLAPMKSDKTRIRQKLNLELGKYYKNVSESRSRRFFEKVIAQSGGEKALSHQADILRKELKKRFI